LIWRLYVKQEFEMYTPPMFKPDRAASLAFGANARLWPRLRVGWRQPDRLVACRSTSPLPTTARRARRFMLRVTIPLVKLAGGTGSWLLAVTGADAYVSPDWYVSPDQVPTWLYEAVHLTGTVRTLSDDELAEQNSIRSAPSFGRLAVAEKAVDIVEDDGGAARHP